MTWESQVANLADVADERGWKMAVGDGPPWLPASIGLSGGDVDAEVFVERSAVWSAETIVALVERTADVDVVGPMVYHERIGPFYDTRDTRRNGAPFSRTPPYHLDLMSVPAGGLLQMSSLGSCAAARGGLSRLTEFQGWGAWCADIRQLGGKLWLLPERYVIRP